MMPEERPIQARLAKQNGPSPQQRKRTRGGGPNNWESRRGRPRRNRHQFLVPSKQKKPTCSQCQEEEPKYKCTKCRAPYCSIVCCRSHKEKGCEELKKEPVKQELKSKYLPSDLLLRDPLENAIQRRRKTSEEDLAEGWKITNEMMDAMDKCEWLQSELEDGGLRQIIHQVCDSSNTVVAHGQKTHQEVALEQAKAKYPNFDRFMDKLLVLTGVLERQQETQHDEELGEWLNREGNEELGPLALVPIPRRKKRIIETPVKDQDGSSSYSSSSDESESDESESETSEESSSSGDEDDA